MKKILIFLILVVAITLATTVAYVSISGLLKLFSGAGTIGLIFFTSIEICKIIATSAIHTYGKKIGWMYKSLLTLGIVITMLITSMGIYGFLSSTYKESFAQLENTEKKIEILTGKKYSYQTELDQMNSEKSMVSENIKELSSGLSNNVIEYRDKETDQILRTTSSSTRRVLERQLDKAVKRQEVLNEKTDTLTQKIFRLDNQILYLNLNNEASNELGPLIYLSNVTGMTMDEVMKWFIILLIIIGDPMAVLLIIIFNKIINKEQESIVKKKVKVKSEIKKEKIVEEGYVIEKPIETIDSIESKEEGKIKKVSSIKNRGFSVTIPNRRNNTIDRIGSNKEMRDGNSSKIYFKKRKT
jgi:cell division protein FtsB